MTLLIIYAVLSIFFSFLCSILEAALLSFTPNFIRIKKQEGHAYATTIANYKKDIDKPLISILTINTIAHTVGAILVGVQAESLEYDINILGVNIVGIVSGVMTFLILILSEIIPKTIGATYWEKLGPFTATFLKVIIFPLKYTGILWLLMFVTKAVGSSAHVNAMSREEFLAMTNAAEQEGVFEENETTVIKNLLVFKSVKAKDVMTPFTVVTAESEIMTMNKFQEIHKNIRFSRIPVYENKMTNITGFVLRDEILESIINNEGEKKLLDIRRNMSVVNSERPIPELFEIFIKDRVHIAQVVDEFGNTIGIVTMEDIIETLLGLEIMDEIDSVEDMQVHARKNWEIRAKKMGINN
ncbi:CNNM domain-containing protein [Frigoriflavimonas asaccharolytica]|uniref:CBS domain containing-hemolysin-like protein n=1 Tax=Frigoriflavimonas asaccharolytica TaxID=2735899 RepID=A0A8J8G7K3_9FLAO|nr:CNNM domain-containing protein [Frigoriflavimonas asaccharolytica]NRS92756.1 CBS domain containing-hemolysin-like protein [Frigoriflavimonas asaccharolytica]